MIINDEAHHVHDEDLAWSQSLLGIHKALPKGASLWLDFSATPRDQNRIHFAWTICDYPLAQAWVVVQKAGKKEVNWIIETKGRVWPGTGAKYEAIRDWCERISQRTGTNWNFAPVNQGEFDFRKPKTLAEATRNPENKDVSLL